MADELKIPKGLVVITTWGAISAETSECIMETRSRTEAMGIKDITYKTIGGALVDKARNEAVRMMFNLQAGWVLYVDGDMTFETGSIAQLLQTAYGTHPHFDVVGGYCNLRGEMALPTIDSGTGTWESWFPYAGVVEVMRTGGAFLLCKRHVFERLKEPWFAMRVPARPIDFLAEVDNYTNICFDGKNPFRDLPGHPWEKMVERAANDPSAAGNFTPNEVGEDSGFCDRVRNAGMRIAVNTNVVTGHKDSKLITWMDHKKALDEVRKYQRLCCGLLA